MLPPRAYFFIGLNGVRILSIIIMLLVFASNIVTLVHDVEAVNTYYSESHNSTSSSSSNSTTSASNDDYIANSTVPNQPAGVFWAVVNRLLIIGQVMVLIMSEFGFPARFFNRFFPILGDDFGLGALGCIQCLLGAAILSHFVDDFTLVSAFMVFVIGCVNIFLGLVFRQGAKTKRSVTSWREHAKGALPTHVGPVPVPSNAPDIEEVKNLSANLGFGRKGEKNAALKGFLISKPLESLPRHMPSHTAA
ncbi:hypothetical protein FISHEDRAFT_44960 [Fistulina hepatica ATCC 64428]|uniref:DUF7598 domain-containing protein n=1 Tax=Fistulina hepatica ATCC 64428 TaxID=1128425 RepID=A0A0D7AAF5_9AGAR|nr:hypothetical protein FISHEDRAFT_44960 [Fistulina hepatica ATCC 64428]